MSGNARELRALIREIILLKGAHGMLAPDNIIDDIAFLLVISGHNTWQFSEADLEKLQSMIKDPAVTDLIIRIISESKKYADLSDISGMPLSINSRFKMGLDELYESQLYEEIRDLIERTIEDYSIDLLLNLIAALMLFYFDFREDLLKREISAFSIDPNDMRILRDLAQIHKSLKDRFEVPEEYREPINRMILNGIDGLRQAFELMISLGIISPN